MAMLGRRARTRGKQDEVSFVSRSPTREAGMTRSYRWVTQQGGGFEHLALTCIEEEIVAEGVVIGPGSGELFPGELFACNYTLRCDPQWRVRKVAVHMLGGESLLLLADGEGRWSGADGQALPALEGCIDVDLSCTPFTNTLPIRRLGERLRERQEIALAFIDIAPLQVTRARQAYTRIAPERYLFESLDHPFSAEIDTDGEGLVTCYPGLFTRASA